MKYTEKEVLQFVEENDVKFVKLMFCDIFGSLKTISVIAGELPKIFREGLIFDASKLGGFLNVTASDLRLFPDPDTLALLPWRPQHGRVVRFFCHLKYPDGTAFEGDGRFFLKTAIAYAKGKGYNFQIGTSWEFYCFVKDDTDMPTKRPHDYAGYCDAAPVDRGENLRRDICLTLEQMDIFPESSRHETGPGQNEIDFQYSNALKAADNLVTFKNVVKSVADRNGLYATFMPKPLDRINGSGMHMNMSLFTKDGNAFFDENGEDQLSQNAKYFLGGLLKHARSFTAVTNPTVNSYKRLVPGYEAPVYVAWSGHNRSPLVRVPIARGLSTRLELRSVDPSANPYLAVATILAAGLDGLKNKIEAPKAIDRNIYAMDDDERKANGIVDLPSTLHNALKELTADEVIKKAMGPHLYSNFVEAKRLEWAAYRQEVSEWERQQYLELY